MRKRILQYRKQIDVLLKTLPEGTDWADVLREHLQQIAFFQHERLVHLIVTMTVALLTLLSMGIALVAQIMTLLLLTAVLAVLLIPYILHYYLLENEVQKMYVQYDRLLELVRECSGESCVMKDGYITET